MMLCENMMSVMNNIEIKDFCCSRGAYSDAYILVRKYRDDLIQYPFIVNIIKSRHGLKEEKMKGFLLDVESVIKMLEKDFQILVLVERKSNEEFFEF